MEQKQNVKFINLEFFAHEKNDVILTVLTNSSLIENNLVNIQ